MNLPLPRITELVARQIAIQAQIENRDIAPEVGKIYIENLQKIIASTEVAEQAKLEESIDAQEASFELGQDANESQVRVAMLAVYQDVERGKISGQVGAMRIKMLDAIVKSLKNQALVQVNIGVVEPISPEVISNLDLIEERLRGYHKQISFAVKEISRLTSLPENIVMERVKSGNGMERVKSGNSSERH